MMPVSTGNSQQHYRPFGETIEAPKDDVGYTGHKFDTDLGLSYMQQRYFNPVTGRFLSNDPIGIRSVHSFNRYAYANNNPFRYVDPDGQLPKRVVTNPLKKPPSVVPPGSRPGANSPGARGHSTRDSNDRGSPRTDRQGNPIVKNESAEGSDPVNEVTTDATPGKKTKGKTTNWVKSGGIDQANEDFDKLVTDGSKEVSDDKGNKIRTGTLSDGRSVNVRNKSTDGRPTVEIRNGKKKTKIRYDN
jgi:RHS repeat-associated protein